MWALRLSKWQRGSTLTIKYDCKTGMIVTNANEIPQEEFQTQKQKNRQNTLQRDITINTH